MKTMSVSAARDEFAEVVNLAGYGGQRTVVERHGRPVAAIVPAEDVAILEMIENEMDMKAVRAALADPANARPVSWDAVRSRFQR